ncbi:MAG: hypothetical protein U1E28_01615 [Beijerinckiaceae bacterium]
MAPAIGRDMLALGWVDDWVWGLLLIAVTLAIHAGGLVMIAVFALKFALGRPRLPHGASPLRPAFVGALAISVIGFALAALHGIEASVWAFAYLAVGAFGTLRDAMLFSLDSLTTRGASGLTPKPEWALMGALEAAGGVLAFGASTAFLFSVLQVIWRGLRASFRLPQAPAGSARQR